MIAGLEDISTGELRIAGERVNERAPKDRDITEAMTLGDRVVVLRGGIVQQIGAPQELYDRPNNLFVAGFIGSPSMNFFPGQLTAD
eukprot:gene24999-30001_t